MLKILSIRLFLYSMLVLLMWSVCLPGACAQEAEPSESEKVQIPLRGWFSFGMVVSDLANDAGFKPRVTANLFGGFYLTNWLAFCAGPGLRVNDGYFHVPFYGGLRFADRRKEISPYLFLAGGAVTNPDIGAEEGYLISLAEAGIQFNFEKVHFTIFMAYENLPLYRTAGTFRATGLSRAEFRGTRRYEFMSIGLAFGF